MSGRYRIVLPMKDSLLKDLLNIKDGWHGNELISVILTGFIKNMLINRFDLSRHLDTLEYLDDVSTYEIKDMIDNCSVIITCMTIDYRRYFNSYKYEEVSVTNYYYNRNRLIIEYKVR